MLIDGSIVTYVQGRQELSDRLSDSVTKTLTGLKTDIGSSDNFTASQLKVQSSTISQSISNANHGVALMQISDIAMQEQYDLLEVVKAKLNIAKKDTTTVQGREAIRSDVKEILDTIDELASKTNLNEAYTLQRSDSDNAASLPISLQIGENEEDVVMTDSIRSNTEGFSLTTLKNLNTDELTAAIADAQMDVVDDALELILLNQSSFETTKEQISIGISTMTRAKGMIDEDYNSLVDKIDFEKESLEFDKNSMFFEFGDFAYTQANALQNSVVSLLSYDTSSFNIKQ